MREKNELNTKKKKRAVMPFNIKKERPESVEVTLI